MKSLTGMLVAASFLLCALIGARAQAIAQPSDYKLTANDLLDFRVFQEPELDAVIRISGDGVASFPLVGAVSIGARRLAKPSKPFGCATRMAIWSILRSA